MKNTAKAANTPSATAYFLWLFRFRLSGKLAQRSRKCLIRLCKESFCLISKPKPYHISSPLLRFGIAATSHNFGSLRGTLVQHNTLEHFREMNEQDFPSLYALQQRWDEEERSMREYLASLGDDDITGIVRYSTPKGEQRERLLWHCLLHVVNHGTQHRSEAAIILTNYGHSPGDLDFTVFLNERQVRR